MALLGLESGCSRRPAATVMLSTELFELIAQPLPTDERHAVEWTLRHANQVWSVHTRIPNLAAIGNLATPEARQVLARYLSWTNSYLFIREDTGHREGARAVVDHVFKCTDRTVLRLGTLAGSTGPPGSQWIEGRFRDAYDRLEFSPLAAPDKGPVFGIVLVERSGKFRVDAEATWNEARARYERHWKDWQEPEAAAPAHPTAAMRAKRAAALFCLSLSRYCGRDAEFEQARRLAQRTVEGYEELLEEVETVVPGEMAASRDEVLRAHPALVNLFKESPEQPAETDSPSLRTLPPPTDRP